MFNSECKIGVAQINSISGDLEFNSKKIAEYIKRAVKQKLQLLLFPEFALVGNFMERAVQKFPFLLDESMYWLQGLAKIEPNMYILIGFIHSSGKSAVALLHNGIIENVIFQDDAQIITVNGTIHLISVGKIDIANQGLHYDNIIIFNSMNFPSECVARLMSNTPTVYVNCVGMTDCNTYSGNSALYNEHGELVDCAKSYEEDLWLIDFNKSSYKIPESQKISNEFSLDYEQDLERVYKIVVNGIRDYFKKCNLKRAVLGLSGGLDSTVCAVLLADAIGKENVYGVSMPSVLTSEESKSDAEILACNLGINFITAGIKSVAEEINNQFRNLFNSVEKNWGCRYKNSYTNDNIQARCRALYLWGISNEFDSCIPIATSDKSELYMGYATINGDMSGGIAPIADITKTKLFTLARWLNKNREQKNAIPETIINKRPSAELAINPETGKILLAEEALMPYEFLDEVIWRIEHQKQSYNDILKSKFYYEKNNNVSFEQKQNWLDKFFKRYSSSLYKGSILPPAIVTEPYSNIKTMYSQPITSNHIDYKGKTEEEIFKILSEI